MPSPSTETFKTKCPHCGVSITARKDKEGKPAKCPGCENRFVVTRIHAEKANGRFDARDFENSGTKSPKANIERTVWVGSPNFWKANVFAFCFLAVFGLIAWTVAIVIGNGNLITILLVATLVLVACILLNWFICSSTNLEITEKRVTLKTGVFSKSTNEIRHSDVRNIQVSQGVFDRIFDIGTIKVSSAAQSDIEIAISGIDSPGYVAELIRERQQ